MNDDHRPAESGPDHPCDPASPGNGAPADRRSFLRGIAAAAAGAAGGALLGESLLVRGAHAQPAPRPWSVHTFERTFPYTTGGTLPRTHTQTGTLATQPGDPTSFSSTVVQPAWTVVTYTGTTSHPAPPQPVTIAGTRTTTYTGAPTTITLLCVLRDSNYTMTVSRDATDWAASVTESYSYTYTANDDDDNDGEMPGGDHVALGIARAELHTLDAEGLVLFDPFGRGGEPVRLRFAGGAPR